MPFRPLGCIPRGFHCWLRCLDDIYSMLISVLPTSKLVLPFHGDDFFYLLGTLGKYFGILFLRTLYS